jgi:hypothetical protein
VPPPSFARAEQYLTSLSALYWLLASFEFEVFVLDAEHPIF